MNSAKKTLLAATAAVAAVLPLHQAKATNGMLSHCVGTDSCGMGGAGMALGGNAVSAAVNPALAGKSGNQVMLNAGWFRAERTMDSNGGMGTTDGTITSQNPDFPNGSLGVNYVIDPQWSVNVAMFPGGGGAVKYSPQARINTGSGVNGWDTAVNMQIMLGQASVAYKPNPDVSFGAGLVLGRMSFKTDMATSPNNAQTAGRNRDEHMYGAGFRVGLTGKVTDSLDVAATVRSPIWFEDFEAYQDVFWGSINLPWEAGAGFAYKVTD
ncbi:MAG: hypothetical protein OQK07_04995, partial [Rhodospirillales bacterium]|nr:hypothetical protein [Rhodospirillales bacterium]